MLQEAVRPHRRPERAHVKAALAISASILAAALAGCGARPRMERVEWTVMSTIAAVQTRGGGDQAATDAVRRTFALVERRLNAFDPDSELSLLAPLGEEETLARCDAVMRPCYEAAFRLMRETGGAFNPRWRGEGTLDLGGIAKGFALDLAEAELKASGASASRDILVDLGGNLKAVSGDWTAGVFAPDGSAMRSIALSPGFACATSAEYARGKHIFDGRTGAAVTNDVLSVTVVHPDSAMLADGLSTVMFIFGREEGERFLRERYPETRAIWQMRP